MLNPIDYINQPEGMDAQYNNEYFGEKSKFAKGSTRHKALIMIPNELVDPKTMFTQNAGNQNTQTQNNTPLCAMSTLDRTQFTGINESLR